MRNTAPAQHLCPAPRYRHRAVIEVDTNDPVNPLLQIPLPTGAQVILGESSSVSSVPLPPAHWERRVIRLDGDATAGGVKATLWDVRLFRDDAAFDLVEEWDGWERSVRRTSLGGLTVLRAHAERAGRTYLPDEGPHDAQRVVAEIGALGMHIAEIEGFVKQRLTLRSICDAGAATLLLEVAVPPGHQWGRTKAFAR